MPILQEEEEGFYMLRPRSCRAIVYIRKLANDYVCMTKGRLNCFRRALSTFEELPEVFPQSKLYVQ